MSRKSDFFGPASVSDYLLVWLALLALLGLTLASSYVHLRGFNSAVNLAIAGIKATLVALFYMRLRASGALIRFVAAAGVLWILILIGLSLTDVLTRT